MSAVPPVDFLCVHQYVLVWVSGEGAERVRGANIRRQLDISPATC